ncbi:oligosaccharide flippase family protein, partial [Citrobacter freundii]|nr:oligosaccharide flippase family protein [Citrobacter freundii]
MINKLFINVVANYVGQLYIAIIGIAVVPIYLSKLGSAGFGLVSFFTLLQSLLVVLDLGISSTLSREVATLKSKAGYLP